MWRNYQKVVPATRWVHSMPSNLCDFLIFFFAQRSPSRGKRAPAGRSGRLENKPAVKIKLFLHINKNSRQSFSHVADIKRCLCSLCRSQERRPLAGYEFSTLYY